MYVLDSPGWPNCISPLSSLGSRIFTCKIVKFSLTTCKLGFIISCKRTIPPRQLNFQTVKNRILIHTSNKNALNISFYFTFIDVPVGVGAESMETMRHRHSQVKER